MADRDMKDVAIYYSEDDDVEEFAVELQKVLEERGLSSFPTYEEGEGDKSLRESVTMAKFRIFLIDSALHKELKTKRNFHNEIIQKHSAKQSTLLVRLDGAPESDVLYKPFIVMPGSLSLINVKKFPIQAKKVAALVEEQIRNDFELDDLESTGDESESSSPRTPIKNETSYSSSGPSSPGEGILRQRKADISSSIHAEKCDQHRDTKSKTSLPFQLVVLLLFASLVGVTCILMTINAKEEQELTTQEKFKQRIEDLKSKIPDQDPRFWRTVRSAMKRHIVEDDPRQPSVLMLVSVKSDAEIRENLAKGIAGAYSSRCHDNEPVMVSGNDYVTDEYAYAKEKIDDVITTGFHNSACAAVVSNFQLLPPASTTTFYQFCENDLAPFKKVSVIFTLEISLGPWDTSDHNRSFIDGKVPDTSKWDKIVEDFLYYNLRKKDPTGIMKDDMIGGLLSRITPAVAWVKGRD